MAFDQMPDPSARLIADFSRDGVHRFARPLDPEACAGLLAELRRERRFGASLFLSEAEFDADPQYTGVNPREGRNLIDRYQDRLGFVEHDPQVVGVLNALLGEDYGLLTRKIVCGVPARHLPVWLKARIEGNPVNNLGAYVRPEYRDVTYFYGIDYHQDLIDYKGREADFVTLYVYLHPVGPNDAPLHVLEGSHRLGASVFPHDLSRSGVDGWRYRNGRHGEMRVREVLLTGGAGQAACWHACTLHGTQPAEADDERISLRYIYAKGSTVGTGLDEVNAALTGPARLSETRIDLDDAGAAVFKHNTVNQG
jgi:phytanoyl-CoA dioxygenase PhyH